MLAMLNAKLYEVFLREKKYMGQLLQIGDYQIIIVPGIGDASGGIINSYVSTATRDYLKTELNLYWSNYYEQNLIYVPTCNYISEKGGFSKGTEIRYEFDFKESRSMVTAIEHALEKYIILSAMAKKYIIEVEI